jgi:hypothetical protein
MTNFIQIFKVFMVTGAVMLMLVACPSGQFSNSSAPVSTIALTVGDDFCQYHHVAYDRTAIDHVFAFAKAAGIKIILSVRPDLNALQVRT